MLTPIKPKHISKISAQCIQPFQLTLWGTIATPNILHKPRFFSQIPWIFPDQRNIKRTSNGMIPPQKTPFIDEQSIPWEKIPTIAIHNPASIEDKEGNIKTMLPWIREWKLLQTLFFMGQERAFVEANQAQEEHSYIVSFFTTIYDIQKSCPVRYSYAQIKEALNILSGVRINLKREDRTRSTNISPITMMFQETNDWKGGMMKITLAEEVTRDLMNLEWRPVDYTALMTATSWLSIWLRDRISTNYIHADYSQKSKYSLLLTTIMEGANMTGYANLGQAHHKIMKAFEDLKDIVKIEDQKRYVSWKRGGRKLIDVLYIITPTITFSEAMIEANKRMKKLRLEMEAHNERRKHSKIYSN